MAATDYRAAGLITLAAIISICVFFFFDPYPQPASYFAFADSRTVFGVANFWNVASNALFLVFGTAGLILVGRPGALALLPELGIVYRAFFWGIVLTAFGSAWFHLNPAVRSLFWDRLPMTVAFMAFFAMVIGEHASPRAGRILLWPLLLAGVLSTVVWLLTESAGNGDLRAYALVQFLPILLIPLIVLAYPSRFDSAGFYWGVVLLYAAAKVLEFFDAGIFRVGGILSGHTLKHLAASLVPLVLLVGMSRRKRAD